MPKNNSLLRSAFALVLFAATSVGAFSSALAKSDAHCGAACVATRFQDANGVRYAYRTLGAGNEPPLVLLNRFRGTMDEWDPAFLDALARERRVVIFDNVGVARTNGTAATRLVGWAENAAAFIDSLGSSTVDVFGFSFGGLVAQELAHLRPNLVRRLIIAGSGAGYVEGATLRPEALAVATRPANTDEDFLFLFFRNTPSSQAAGRAHLARLRQRSDAFSAVVSEQTWRAMLSAASDVGSPETSLLNRAPSLTQPVLVANGIEDAMIPTYQSFALARALPNARLVLYPDSGHAFMFQHIDEFAAEVARFLR